MDNRILADACVWLQALARVKLGTYRWTLRTQSSYSIM